MISKKLIILGSGGHADVLIDTVQSSGKFTLEGMLEKKVVGIRCRKKEIEGVPLLGGEELLSKYKGMYIAIGVGSTRSSDIRKKIFTRCKRLGFKFPVIIHPSAYVSKSAKLEDGVQVMTNAIIHPGAVIGENAIINTAVIIEHGCNIAPHCHISIGAILAGDVRVGECSYIGMGANILQGIKIGMRVTVGAGSVVTKDVPDGQTVVGAPARRIHE